MKQELLDKLIEQYILNFDRLNNNEHCEYFKWEAAYEFSHFDFDDPADFVKRLKHLNKTCRILIDKQSIHPFNALCMCASVSEENAERVRRMFCDLFAEDGNDLKKRQEKITVFIKESDELRAECGKNGYPYQNDQTSVMAYLAMRDPDHNYLLSTGKARELAKRLNMSAAWGTLSAFKLDVYNQFCDQLAAGLRNNEAMMQVNAKRFAPDFAGGKHLPFHEDAQLHILVFDIIYAAYSGTYNLGAVLDEYVTSSAGKGKKGNDTTDTHKEPTEEEIAALRAAFLQADEENTALLDALAFVKRTAVAGQTFRHKKYGKVTISEVAEGTSRVKSVREGRTDLPAAFDMEFMLANGIITFEDPDLEEARKQYQPLLARKVSIRCAYEEATAAMEPYWD